MPYSKQKNLTRPYACIQALYWMYFAAIMSFSGFFLLDGGFSNTQIGIIAAAAGIISALLQPVLASYADRPDSPSLKKLIQIFYMIQLLLGVGLFFFQKLDSDRTSLWHQYRASSVINSIYQCPGYGKHQSGTAA